jgi:hypothetical protein
MKSFLPRNLMTPFLWLAISLWLLLILFILNITTSSSLDGLQNTASNFFVRCDTGECSSIILPFLSYVFNPYNLPGYVLGLWAIVSLVLGIYFFIQLIKTYDHWEHKSILLCAILLITLVSSFGTFQAGALPCILAALIAGLKGRCNDPNREIFIVISILFDLSLGVAISLTLTTFYFMAFNSKKMRLDMIRIVKSILIGCLIITIYLAMIDYNFIQINSPLKTEFIKKNIWADSMKFISLYLSTLVALIFINAK